MLRAALLRFVSGNSDWTFYPSPVPLPACRTMLSQVVVFLKLKWKIILINCAFIFSLIHAFDLDHQIGRKRFVVGFASGLTSFPALSQSQLLSKMDASFAGSFLNLMGK